MKLHIDGVPYDYQRAQAKAGLLIWYALKEQSSAVKAPGVGPRSVGLALEMLSEALLQDDGESDDDYLTRNATVQEDPDFLLGMAGLVYICKRFAGEDVSFADAGTVALNDLRFVAEESDRAAPDPTEASAAEPARGSSNGSKSNGSTTSSKKSKTSKSPSTAASS